ncbi:MAG: CoA-binding protein [Candidatus Absconditabacteria bacterium]
MIDQNSVYAVIGASANTEKYGNKTFLDLFDAGYKVYAVNNRDTTDIEGNKVYPKLTDLPVRIDVVIFVVPPEVTERLIPVVYDMGISHVWMQPGAQSDKAIALCETLGIDCIHDACIMIKRRKV